MKAIKSLKQYTQWCLALSGFMMLAACGNNNSGNQPVKEQETASKGHIRISVDESFRPVIDSQIKVFNSTWPDAKIDAEYKPEAECLKDLSNDSFRMVIVTRGLTQQEAQQFKAKLGATPNWGVVAWDAVAVVLNKDQPDSTFSTADIKEMLAGNTAYSKYKLVMDGNKATSIVRYAVDSLLKGTPLSPNVQGAKNSQEVIDFVGKNKNAIGLVGVNWVGNDADPDQLSFSNKVKVASLRCETCEETTYTKPYQANIAMARYPMLRGIYYILKENFSGVGRSFMGFMTTERGQLIFKRAYLLPAQMRFEVRDVKITQ